MFSLIVNHEKKYVEKIKFILHFFSFAMELIKDFYFSLTIMVNRGWIPRRDRSTFKMGNKITDSVEIVGIIRTTEKRPQFVPENAPAKGVWHYK